MMKQNFKQTTNKLLLNKNNTKTNENKHTFDNPSRFDELVRICESISNRQTRPPIMQKRSKGHHNIIKHFTQSKIINSESSDLWCNEQLVNFHVLRDKLSKSSKSLKLELPEIKERDGQDQEPIHQQYHKEICLTQRVNLQKSQYNLSAHCNSSKKHRRAEGSSSTCSKTKDNKMNRSVANLSTKQISAFQDGSRKANININVKKLIETKLNKQSGREAASNHKKKAKSSMGYYDKVQKVMR